MDPTCKGLIVRDVSITFKGHTLIDRANLEVAGGSTLCIVGRNGCGKSTLMRVMAGLQLPGRGSVEIIGCGASPRLAGVWSGRAAVQARLSVWENLEYFAGLQGQPRAAIYSRGYKLLERLELQPERDKRAGTLSSGLRMRLAFAMALIGVPDVLFLDEPDSNVDASSLASIVELIREFAAGGGIVVCASHEPRLVSEIANEICRIRPNGAITHLTRAEFHHLTQSACYQLELCRPAPSTVFSHCGVEAVMVNAKEFVLPNIDGNLVGVMQAAAPFGISYLRLVTNPIERVLLGGVPCQA